MAGVAIDADKQGEAGKTPWINARFKRSWEILKARLTAA